MSRWTLEPDTGAWESMGLEVATSAIAGRGLFTTLARAAGERIAPITGETISGDEAELRDGEGNVYIYEIDDDHYVDAADGLGRYVNHHCAPSCRIEGRDERSLWLVAARDLGAGDELTIDYDYPEIFEACERSNPRCLKERCPRER